MCFSKILPWIIENVLQIHDLVICPKDNPSELTF